MSEREFAFEILERDLVTAQFLNMRPRQAMRIAGSILVAIMVVVLVYSAAIQPSRKSLGVVFGTAGAGLGVAVYLLVLVPRKARRFYRQQKLLHGRQRLSYSADGIAVSSDFGSVRLPWSTFHKWKENSDLILLYHTDMMFTLLPKRNFPSAEELAQFKALVTEHVRCAA